MTKPNTIVPWNYSLLPMLCIALLLQLLNASAVAMTTPLDPYDYSETKLLILHGEEGAVFLANPFEYPAPVMGALVYEIVLKYAAQFQETTLPIEEPTFILDLIAEDDNYTRYVGRRLYIGEDWISDGLRIAYLEQADFIQLKSLLTKRYANTEKVSDQTVKSIALEREEGTDGSGEQKAVSEHQSIKDAMARMGLSDTDTVNNSSGPTEDNRQSLRASPDQLEGAGSSVEPALNDTVTMQTDQQDSATSDRTREPVTNSSIKPIEATTPPARERESAIWMHPVLPWLLALLVIFLVLKIRSTKAR